MELSANIKNIFTIACDTYGLSPQQLYIIINSLKSLEQGVTNYDKKLQSEYVEHYNILSKLLESAQKNGGIFKLEIAGKVFDALIKIKAFLVDQKIGDDLDSSFAYIQSVLIKCIFSKCIYTVAQISEIIDLLDLFNEFLVKGSNKIDYMDNYKKLESYVDIAQSKGKFSLEDSNLVLKTISSLKKKIIQFNVDKQKLGGLEEDSEDEYAVSSIDSSDLRQQDKKLNRDGTVKKNPKDEVAKAKAVKDEPVKDNSKGKNAKKAPKAKGGKKKK